MIIPFITLMTDFFFLVLNYQFFHGSSHRSWATGLQAVPWRFLVVCLFQFYHWNVLLVWVFNRQVVKQTLVCLHYTEKVGRYISAGFVCIFKAAYFNRSLEKTSELLLDFWRCDAVLVVLHIKFLPLHEYLGFAQSFNYICNNWE